MGAPIDKYDPFGLYRKSLDIFHLSRGIADYVSYQKDLVNMRVSKKKADRYASDIVLDALGLVPKITQAVTQKNPAPAWDWPLPAPLSLTMGARYG